MHGDSSDAQGDEDLLCGVADASRSMCADADCRPNDAEGKHVRVEVRPDRIFLINQLRRRKQRSEFVGSLESVIDTQVETSRKWLGRGSPSQWKLSRKRSQFQLAGAICEQARCDNNSISAYRTCTLSDGHLAPHARR